MKGFLTFLIFSCVANLVIAESIDTLKLSVAIQIGLENNFNIQISEGQAQIASNNNTYGNAGFLPTLDVTAAQRYTTENTNQKFASGLEQNRSGAKSNNFSSGAAFTWT